MKITNLYCYHGENGAAVVTPVLLPMEYEPRLRIEGDAGMLVTNGEISVKVFDISANDIDNWTEIPEPEEAEAE